MPQMHLYVSQELAQEVRRRARQRGETVSQYLAGLVRDAVTGGWPEGFFAEVAGGWRGAALQRPAQPAAEEREPL